MDPTDLVLDTALKASVTEGVKLLPDTTLELWDKMKGLLGKWFGKRKGRAEGALQDVVSNPKDEVIQTEFVDLLREIAKAEEPDDELRALAEQLKALLDADERVAEATAGVQHIVQQTVKNVSDSVVVQHSGDGDVNVTNAPTEKKTS